jgi:hypothetical protein
MCFLVSQRLTFFDVRRERQFLGRLPGVWVPVPVASFDTTGYYLVVLLSADMGYDLQYNRREIPFL